MEIRRSILVVKPDSLAVYDYGKNKTAQFVQEHPWSAAADTTDIEQLVQTLRAPVTVLFSAVCSYVLMVPIPTNSPDEVSLLYDTLAIHVPENLVELDWLYQKIDAPDGTTLAQVFAPVSNQWLPIKQALLAMDKKVDHLLPLISGKTLESEAVEESLHQTFIKPDVSNQQVALSTISPNEDSLQPHARSAHTLLILTSISFLLAIGVSILVVLTVLQ